ncbi:MAG: formylglycine-generating enzyme family protein [Gammaproteobacteria bacterium]|nr:formylglycine-generating enzyme family protein [Gammaproteobacteria bacterium]
MWTSAAPAEEASPALQLLAAAREGDLPEVRRLVEEGAYEPTTLLGMVALAAASAGNGKEHGEIAALLQAKLDEHLESGAFAESLEKAPREGPRERAAKNPDDELNVMRWPWLQRETRERAAKNPDDELNRRLLERLGGTDLRARPRQVGDRFRDCPKCPEMTVLPSGAFEMGSPATEEGRKESEGPRHRVAIGVPVAMSSHEVTVAEFAHFAAETRHSTSDSCWTFDMSFSELIDTVPESMSQKLHIGIGAINRAGRGWRNPGFNQDGRHPVVCVSWDDARAYAHWLSGETGESYRLPSEAEWEYAVRAGTDTATYWGDASPDACHHMNGPPDLGAEMKAQVSGESTDLLACRDDYRHSSTVGSFEPNGFGLYDMLGNAWEWTADCANKSYRNAPSDGSAWQGGQCSARAVRGGSYEDSLHPARSALRKFLPKGDRVADVGFRVVRSMRTDAPDVVASGDVKGTRETGRGIGERFRDCPGCPEMVVVPEGSFEMGSRRREKGRYKEEGPVRDVKIADGLAVGVYEVTRSEFARFVSEAQHTTGGICELAFFGRRATVGVDGWRSPGFRQHGSHPVVCVDWHDARAYTQWLSRRTGKTYRLPSEAEWEYVARAGSTAPRPWLRSEDARSGRASWARQCAYVNGADLSLADELIAHQAYAVSEFADAVSGFVASCEDWHFFTAPVGSYRSNDFGVHDIIGNVYEWTEDCWNKNYRRAPTDGGPWTAGDCRYRVGRSGAYLSGSRTLRPAYRGAFRDTDRLTFVGFRVVRPIAAGPSAGRLAERD